MNQNYSQYPTYYEVKSPVFKQVPQGWKFLALKRLLSFGNGKDHKHIVEDEGRYPVYGSGGCFAFASQFLHEGESVLFGRKGTIDKPLYVNEKFWTVDTMYFTRINADVNARFVYYVALSIPFSFYTTNTALPSITQEALGNHKVAVPSLEEQTQIARFLDYETAKIDALIEKQEQLIALLEEKRQAVISHAVTKGLNPDAPMKDSGIEWLGEIPAHWEVINLKHLLSTPVRSGVFKKKDQFGSGAKLVNVGDLYPDEYFIDPNLLECVQVTPDERKKFQVYSGDIFFVRSSLKMEGVGRVACLLEEVEDIVFECHVVRGSPNQIKCSSKFLTRYLNSPLVAAEFIRRANTTTMTTIAQGSLVTIPVPLPPRCEQVSIDDFLDRKLHIIANITSTSLAQMDLLRERRTALISAAVTGKIDVRDWQPPQSEEEEA